MHNYSITNTKIRITVISFIAVVSAYLSFMLNSIISLLPLSLEPLSPFLIFGILFFIFDRCAWKIWPLNSLIKIPNFNGIWKGQCQTTSTNTNKKKSDMKIKIKQTFTKIIVDAIFDNSHSESFSADVDYNNPYRPKLIYSYLNKPQGSSVSTMDKHLGTVEICINNLELCGDYFTDRQPQTKGSFNLKKEES